MKIEFSRHILEKYSNIKFHENPSSGEMRQIRSTMYIGLHIKSPLLLSDFNET